MSEELEDAARAVDRIEADGTRVLLRALIAELQRQSDRIAAIEHAVTHGYRRTEPPPR